MNVAINKPPLENASFGCLCECLFGLVVKRSRVAIVLTGLALASVSGLHAEPPTATDLVSRATQTLPTSTHLAERTLRAIRSNSMGELTKLSHPRLTGQLDAPVVHEWMRAINDSMGAMIDASAMQETRVESESASTENPFDPNQQSDSEMETKLAGPVVFEKGVAEVELCFVGNRLTTISIQSDQMKGDWFANGPTDPSVYLERAQQLFDDLLAENFQAARTTMHNSLRKQASPVVLKCVRDQILGLVGNDHSVEITGGQFQRAETGHCLLATLEIQGEQGSLPAVVQFRFSGLKGHLTQFSYEPEVQSNEELEIQEDAPKANVEALAEG